MNINCIIIEDEPLALKRAESYVVKIPGLNLLRSFDNAIDALDFLEEQDVHLLFLDIKMDELTGIELLESITRKPFVIITTAYNEYAIKGFELNITDYLLKPYTFQRFLQAVEKVKSQMAQRFITQKDYIFVKTEYRIEKVLYNDILYIEGMRDYRSIQTTGKRVLTLQTFTSLEQELPKNKFCRVHKSYMVSVDKIESIERNRIKIKDKLIPVSDTYKEAFYSLIGIGNNKYKTEEG